MYDELSLCTKNRSAAIFIAKNYKLSDFCSFRDINSNFDDFYVCNHFAHIFELRYIQFSK